MEFSFSFFIMLSSMLSGTSAFTVCFTDVFELLLILDAVDYSRLRFLFLKNFLKN